MFQNEVNRSESDTSKCAQIVSKKSNSIELPVNCRFLVDAWAVQFKFRTFYFVEMNQFCTQKIRLMNSRSTTTKKSRSLTVSLHFGFSWIWFSNLIFNFELIFISDLPLPLEIRRCESMRSIRSRRSQHYQGFRSRRPKRIIEKSGQQNIGFLNISERSKRFFKDLVTTFVCLSM